MAVLIDKNTRLIVQGITGREGTFHAKAGRGLRHHRRRRRDARARAGRRTRAGRCSTPSPNASTATGANASVIFVPPPGGADAILEAADAGLAARRLHHRRHPDARHAARVRRDSRRQDPPHRPELSGAHHRRAGQGRHHSRAHLQGRARRHRVEERHADLRSDPPAHQATGWARRPASGSAAIR